MWTGSHEGDDHAPFWLNAVLGTALLILTQSLSAAPAQAECITVEDVTLRLGAPTAHLMEKGVERLSEGYEAVHGEPFVRSDEALVYREYVEGPAAAVRVILFRDGCGLRDGGMPRQIYDVLMAHLR